MSVRKSSHGTIFTSKKPFCPMTRSLHPPMTACGHRVRFVATWREEFFEVPKCLYDLLLLGQTVWPPDCRTGLVHDRPKFCQMIREKSKIINRLWILRWFKIIIFKVIFKRLIAVFTKISNDCSGQT